MFNILEKIICYGRAAQDSWCDFICCISKWIHDLQHPLLVHGGLQFQIMNKENVLTPVQYNSYWQIDIGIICVMSDMQICGLKENEIYTYKCLLHELWAKYCAAYIFAFSHIMVRAAPDPNWSCL